MSSPSPTTASPPLQTYHGNCHCGAFKFSIRIPSLTSVTECNCSICFKKGYKWVFPGEGCFVVEKGEGHLEEYWFGQRTMVHKFCPTCGTGILGERQGVPESMKYAINARTLMDIDLWSLEVIPYDGTARAPLYQPPLYTGSETPTTIANPKTYTGACHCGAVTLSLKTKGPLPAGGEYIQECDCSICARNGTTLVYPHPTQLSIFTSTSQAISSYTFNPSTQAHKFCSNCGISIYIERLPISLAIFQEWHSSGSYNKWLDNQAVNLRCFSGVEWKEIQVKRAFWSRSEPSYVCPE